MKDQLGKIVKEENMSNQHKVLCEIAHIMAKEALPQIWNVVLKELQDLPPITGDDALSCMSTFLAEFVSLWVTHMKIVADQDETGYTKEGIFSLIFTTAQQMLRIGVEPLKKSEPKSLLDIQGVKNETI